MLLVCGTSAVFADNFYPSGDSAYCEVAQAAAISYGELPPSDASLGMTYDASSIEGRKTWQLLQGNIESVADVTYPDARRINGIASHVSVPPNTKIDLDVFFYNFSGHEVVLKEGIFFVSMPSSRWGDLTKLGSDGWDRIVSINYLGTSIDRHGKAVWIKNWKTLPAHSYSALPKGEVFYSFKTIQPAEVINREVNYEFNSDGEFILKYKTDLRNNTDYLLKDVYVEDIFPDGEIFSKTLDLEERSITTLEYEKCLCYDYDYEIPISEFMIDDPNSHYEKASYGVAGNFSYDPGTRVFFTRRSDSTNLYWTGNQGDFTVSGEGDFISVKLLPYTIYTQPFSIDVRPNVQILPSNILEDDSDLLEVEGKASDVYDIEIKIENSEAYLNNAKLIIEFDDEKVDFVNDSYEVLEDGRLALDLGRISTAEIINLSEEFKISEDFEGDTLVSQISYQIIGDEYESEIFTKRLIVNLVKEETETIKVSKNGDVQSQIYYNNLESGDILGISTLAKTGVPIYKISSILIILGIWTLKKLLKSKKQEKLHLSFQNM